MVAPVTAGAQADYTAAIDALENGNKSDFQAAVSKFAADGAGKDYTGTGAAMVDIENNWSDRSPGDSLGELKNAGQNDGFTNPNASANPNSTTDQAQTAYNQFDSQLQSDGSNDQQRAADASSFMQQLQSSGAVTVSTDENGNTTVTGQDADLYNAAQMVQTEAQKGDGEGNNKVDQTIMASAAAKDGLTPSSHGVVISNATFDNTTGNYDGFTKFTAQQDVNYDFSHGAKLSSDTVSVLGAIINQGGASSGGRDTATTMAAKTLVQESGMGDGTIDKNAAATFMAD